MPALYCENERPLPVEELPSPFYSTEVSRRVELPSPRKRADRSSSFVTQVFTSKLITQLEARDQAKPFFAYLAYTAPHCSFFLSSSSSSPNRSLRLASSLVFTGPLQAPAAYIAKYRGRYDAGPHALRLARLEQLEKLGLAPKGVKPHPMVGIEGGNGGWAKMTEEERKVSSRGMEIYAAVSLLSSCSRRSLDSVELDGADPRFSPFSWPTDGRVHG